LAAIPATVALTVLATVLNLIGLVLVVAATALNYRETASRDLTLRMQRETVTEQAYALAAQKQTAVEQAQLIVSLKDHLRVVVEAYKVAVRPRLPAPEPASCSPVEIPRQRIDGK
jgi:hypothetical protein